MKNTETDDIFAGLEPSCGDIKTYKIGHLPGTERRIIECLIVHAETIGDDEHTVEDLQHIAHKLQNIMQEG